MRTTPASLTTIARAVDDRLAALLEAETARWGNFDADLVAPIHEIGRLVLAGGKRLRPAFCYWGFVGSGGDARSTSVIDAGGALELLHAFALFHDDVMDGSTTRRGEPTTHTVFIEEHHKGSLAGEARRYGEGVAILVGDLAFVYADLLMKGASPEAWAMWNELRVELNFGQYLDMVGSRRASDAARRPNAFVATRVASTRSSARYTSVHCSLTRLAEMDTWQRSRVTVCHSGMRSRCAMMCSVPSGKRR